MDIITHDPEIVEIRRTVIELILSNHPNDCLKCGRNNECELQKLTAEFGIKEESFPQFLRDLPIDTSTKAVDLDPKKCILCGRCVYVCQECQDVWALSFLERGIKTRISLAAEIVTFFADHDGERFKSGLSRRSWLKMRILTEKLVTSSCVPAAFEKVNRISSSYTYSINEKN